MEALKAEGMAIWATSLDDAAVALDSISPADIPEKLALVIGLS